MTPDLKHITESNRQAWNEVMPWHQQAAAAGLDQAFSLPGHVVIDEEEIRLLNLVGLQGRDVVHLCCNNGSELLSIKNLGAARCLGIDISDAAIHEATQRAFNSHIACQFIRSDIYDLDPGSFEPFDLAYISAGCLTWLPDLDLFFAQAAGLLKPGGHVFIHEIHPFSEMLPYDDQGLPDPLRLVEPYFRSEPFIEQGGLDYLGHAVYPSNTTQFEFVHTLSAILMGLVRNHFQLKHFYEYEKDISAGHNQVASTRAGVPLSYILVGKKA